MSIRAGRPHVGGQAGGVSPALALRLAVVDGRVTCPRRGRVDVLECFMCPFARGLSSEHLERIVCAWDGEAGPPSDRP